MFYALISEENLSTAEESDLRNVLNLNRGKVEKARRESDENSVFFSKW